MSNPDDKTVTILVVHTNGEEEDDWFPQNSDEMIPFQGPAPKEHNLRKKTKEAREKVPLSKKFRINRGAIREIKSESDYF